YLDVPRELYLVLDVRGAQIRPEVIICIRRILPVCHRCEDRRVGKRNVQRSRRIVEESGISEIVRELPADLNAAEKNVSKLPSKCSPSQIGLVEEIQALCCVVIHG